MEGTNLAKPGEENKTALIGRKAREEASEEMG